MTNSFVSVPADLGQLNCAALVAGVIAGVLDGASFVSGHSAASAAEDCTAPFTSCRAVAARLVVVPLGPWLGFLRLWW